jgi:hypothetical protein
MTGNDVYRGCYRTGNSYSSRILLRRGGGVPTAVKAAGDYAVASTGRSGRYSLLLFDPMWRVGGFSVSSKRAVREFALDRFGRLAWVERLRNRVRLKVRTQAGTVRTLAQSRAIAGLDLLGDSVQWSSGGRAHSATVERPACQTIPGEVIARSPDAIVVRQGGPTDSSGMSNGALIFGCPRSDGRWRGITRENAGSSNGTVVEGAVTAGSMVAVNIMSYPEQFGDFDLVDLRTAARFYKSGGSEGARVKALSADGRYVFESGLSEKAFPKRFDGSRLYAGAAGKPDTQLDAGALQAFADVTIQGDVVSWKISGVTKSASLP